MGNFICKTLSPEILWNALSSIATLSAVLVALFMPWWIQYRRANRLERLIRAEIDENLKKLKNIIQQKETIDLPGGNHIPGQQLKLALAQRIDLKLWHQCKFELAADRPESYEKFESVNAHAEDILNIPNQPPQLQVLILNDSAVSFVKRYKELYGE
ncbi:hypothetical protein [Desulfobulbus propionicus]